MSDIKNRNNKDKQQEYYYLERNKYHVNGCCTFEEGYYCGYHESTAVNYEMESWADSNTVRRVLRQLNQVKGKFKVQAQRDRVPDILDELYAKDAPFEYTYRFDLFKAFLRVNKLAKITGQLTSAAAYKENRSDEKGDAVTIPGSDRKDTKKPDANTSDWSYNDAKQQFSKGVEDFEEVIASGMWSYTRSKFENETKIIWCVGPPKCLTPKQTKECPGDGDGSGSCPMPPPCNGTTYSLQELIDLINKEKPNGREAAKWYIDVLDLTNPDCDVVSKLIKVTTLSSTIKLPSFGFLFAPRNASSSDTTIYRIRYDLNSKTLKIAGSIDCDDVPT